MHQCVAHFNPPLLDEQPRMIRWTDSATDRSPAQGFGAAPIGRQPRFSSSAAQLQTVQQQAGTHTQNHNTIAREVYSRSTSRTDSRGADREWRQLLTTRRHTRSSDERRAVRTCANGQATPL